MPGRAIPLAIAALLVAAAGSPPAATAQGRCGSHPWCNTALSADQRAALLVASMSQSDKVALLTGGAASDVGVPSVRFSDGALGPGTDGALFGGDLGALSGGATAMPAGIALAANFDPAAASRYGAVVGQEMRHRGYDGDYGPTVNIMRTPLGGRTFEAYGEDPFLASQTAVGWIDGLQAQGVMADVKHFAANNQEGQVGVSPLMGVNGGRFVVNSAVDERTLEEIELPAFEAAVRRANVATVMCAYNEVNGIYACENRYLLAQLLRGQWGFQGMVLSDAGAAHNTADSLNAGLDYDILSTAYNAPLVDLALATGRVSQATLDARVGEYLRTLFAYGFFDRPAYARNATQDDRATDNAVADQIAEQGATLLRNDGVLPINPSRVHSIAVIGAPASKYIFGYGSSQVKPYFTTTGLQGIEARAARAGIAVAYDDGSDPARAAALARRADATIVFAADTGAEGADKLCMSLTPACAPTQTSPLPPLDLTDDQLAFGDQDGLISAVAAANPRSVVVLETGAPVLTPWRSKIAGLLEAWYPGQDGGTAIARVLFGDVDPGGRLPVSFPRAAGDVPNADDPLAYPGELDLFNGRLFTAKYDEGVMAGYRWYDSRGITPAFPFGFGLSYTSIRYSNLRIARAAAGSSAAYEISVTVANTGRRTGWAVPELYVSLPSLPGVPQPPRQLAGFAKLQLSPQQSRTVTMPLTARSLAYWSTAAHDWAIAAGCDAILVGGSSRDLPLQGTVAAGGAACPGVVGGCARTVTIKIPRATRRRGVRSIRIYLNGRRLRTLRGRRTLVRVALPTATTRVVLRIGTTQGVVSLQRTFHGCAG